MENQNYEQGYRAALSREEKQYFRQHYCQKSVLKGVFLTFLTLLSIYAAVGLFYSALHFEVPTYALVALGGVGLLFITRQMRALENIVHFGSHNNFVAKQSANDQMTNVLAAWPMLQDVKQYRLFHATHHGDYGSHDDPCKERLQRIGAGDIEITNNRQLIWAILLWMPAYVREFYAEVKSSSAQLVIFLGWHAAVAMIAGIFVSWGFAALVLASWTIGMFLILPFLRSVAEFSEHDYDLGDTVRETTFNNLGILDHLLLHPAGDAWHALHHLHPTVPWWKQGAAHRYLMENDAAYRDALHRDALFQDIASFPGQGADAQSDETTDEFKPRFA